MVPNFGLFLGLLLGPCGQVAPPMPLPQAMPAWGPDTPPPGERYAEILAAPVLDDLFRFPPRGAVNQARSFNGAVRYRLGLEREVWPPAQQWKFDLALEQAQAAYRVWDKLDDAQAEWRPWWDRRLQLAQLKVMLGDEAYAAGDMPPAVPSHLFRELK